ncbi:transglutaminase domain-containing protein [Butyrivibrio sp. VCD2006]|uniref:transglutaminase domain-containing protein n=1 Tax=Butyrivibrio sp. VCD2006 TaxID=1280664 RepID=UPI00040AA703|nr:transglutaminase domain-containing protein [Butyrivibrio sp. VCD2006]
MKNATKKKFSSFLVLILSLMLVLSLPVTVEAKAASSYSKYIKQNGVYYKKMPKNYRKGYSAGRKEYKKNASTGYGYSMDEVMGKMFFLQDHVSAFANSSKALSVRESKQTYNVAKSLTKKAKGKKSKYKKALALHDALMRYTKYDYSMGGPYQGQSAYEALVKKTAVCAGISRAYKLMCDIVGIPCYCVYGNAGGVGASGAHQWNVIKLDDGKWYEVDVTFDIGVNSHAFFCLSTSQMANMTLNGCSYYHQRTGLDQATNAFMQVTPVATGTKYRYKGKN